MKAKGQLEGNWWESWRGTGNRTRKGELEGELERNCRGR